MGAAGLGRGCTAGLGRGCTAGLGRGCESWAAQGRERSARGAQQRRPRGRDAAARKGKPAQRGAGDEGRVAGERGLVWAGGVRAGGCNWREAWDEGGVGRENSENSHLLPTSATGTEHPSQTSH